MTKCIIIDDEPLAIRLLASYCEKIESLKLINTFTNPLDAITAIQSTSIDLIFLDIQMPEISGIHLAKLLGKHTQVIFTTAYPEFAVDGFELNALDYLVKPISFQRFISAISRLNKVPSQPSQPQETNSYIFVKTDYRHVKIELREILYLKGFGDYCTIFTKSNKVLTLEKLKSFEKRLPVEQFIRVHKSYIVSLSQIEYIQKNKIIIGAERIPVGATYEQVFKKRISKL